MQSFLGSLWRKLKEVDVTWFLMVDFNEPRLRLNWLLKQFKETLDDSKLSVVPYEGFHFTWDKGSSYDDNVLEHID